MIEAFFLKPERCGPNPIIWKTDDGGGGGGGGGRLDSEIFYCCNLNLDTRHNLNHMLICNLHCQIVLCISGIIKYAA